MLANMRLTRNAFVEFVLLIVLMYPARIRVLHSHAIILTSSIIRICYSLLDFYILICMHVRCAHTYAHMRNATHVDMYAMPNQAARAD